MSKKTNFIKGMEAGAFAAGGSFKTREGRIMKIGCFCRWCWENGFQLQNVNSISVRHIQGFVNARRAEGISLRTIHNYVSAIRCVLRINGRSSFADCNELSNAALGLEGASRVGSKEAFPCAQFDTLLNSALARDEGVAACLWLCRVFGLRSQESVMAPNSLLTWRRNLMRGETSIQVIFGTKGGRTREVKVVNIEKALEAVDFCISVMSRKNGVLIDRDDLKSALNFFHNECRALGLIGKKSPHSLRYAYASELLDLFMLSGFCMKESLALVSISLGHGDGRGRYVSSVYLRKSET